MSKFKEASRVNSHFKLQQFFNESETTFKKAASTSLPIPIPSPTWSNSPSLSPREIPFELSANSPPLSESAMPYGLSSNSPPLWANTMSFKNIEHTTFVLPENSLTIVDKFKNTPFYQANLTVENKYQFNTNILKVRNTQTSIVKYFIYSEQSDEFVEAIEYKSLKNNPQKALSKINLGQGDHGSIHTRGDFENQIAVKKTQHQEKLTQMLFRSTPDITFMGRPKKANETFLYCMKNFNAIGKHFCVPIILDNELYPNLKLKKQVQRKITGINLTNLISGEDKVLLDQLLKEENGETIFSKKFDEFIMAANELGIDIKDSLHVNIMYDKKEECFVLIDFDTAYYTDKKTLSASLIDLKRQVLEALKAVQKDEDNFFRRILGKH